MAAELLEQAELNTEEEHLDELPTEPQQMSSDELLADLEQQQTESVQEEQEELEELPEKYRGKSAKELVRMHQEAEKVLGRQSNELGDMRKQVDTYILSQLNNSNSATETPPEEEIQDTDFFEDPNTAVNQAIEKHPAVQQAAKQAQQLQQNNAVAQLQQKHPDMGEILADPKFAEWVNGSVVRQQLFERADKGYDAAVADELFTLYKERQGNAQQVQKVETEARKQQAKAAQTGSQGQGQGGGSKRIYRRTDIIKLMKTDPDRYEALSPEIMAAYAEGRVR